MASPTAAAAVSCLRGAADVADEDVGVGRAQFLQRRDGSRRGAAAAQDDGGGRGRRAGVAQRVDDSCHVGVVADQAGGAGASPAGGASNATVFTTPRARATPRTSSTSRTMPDFSGMVTDSPRQLSPLPQVLPDPCHKRRQRFLGHVNGLVVQLHAQMGVGRAVQCRRLRMADRVPEHGGPERHTQRPGLASHHALYLGDVRTLCSASVLENKVSLVSRLMVTQ